MKNLASELKSFSVEYILDFYSVIKKEECKHLINNLYTGYMLNCYFVYIELNH